MDAFSGDDRPVRGPFGISGQRRDLRRADSARFESLPAPEAAADSLLVGLATASNIGSVATITATRRTSLSVRSLPFRICVSRPLSPVA